ncbi:AraC family transcriptional regulator [Thalassotalea sp. PP2-459]|uniref:helix-turn-helix domain-containing protein n=1 Tax=Thalassotalea sp. PP2-459 TaxID=1742724 RepID=UPI00094517F5|nr:helix-turn-helix domain-containing protein [Thalassotalea sp. PP2-459]OKY26050.1 AraC family transcriptional regulator [Thalassotalea sp. PP2-459]
MVQWLQQPKCPIVSTFVECYWLIEKSESADSFQFPKLNPDPCGHLIISPVNQKYIYEMDGSITNGNGSHILFPNLHTFQLDHTNPFIHLGIKFKVGAFYSIQPLNEVSPALDTVVPINLNTLLSNSKLDVAALLILAREDDVICREQLDSLLTPWLSQFHQDKYSELTSRTLQILDTTPIAKLGDKLHCTQRTLERAFSRVTGFTLKQCQSMNRLEAMLEHLYSRSIEEIDWAEIAIQFGFSDQPHLIRYLKTQLGVTPNNYAIDRGLTIDAYGGISDQLNLPK